MEIDSFGSTITESIKQVLGAEQIQSFLDISQNEKNRLLNTLIMLYPLIVSLGIGTSLVAAIYYIWDIVIEKIKNMFICSLTIQHTDEVYKWVIKYIQDNKLIESNNQMRVKVKQSGQEWWEQIFNREQKKAKPELDYLPGPGNHIFKYKGYTLWTQFNEGSTQIVGWERIPEKEQDITIYSYSKNISIIRDFIDQCVENSLDMNHGKICIYEQHRWGWGWTKAQTKKPRTIESVILDSNLSESICKEIQEFLTPEQGEWYKSKGIPYRRGYLLYGPPGSGKTSFTEAIAGQCKLNLCYLNLSGETVDDDGLNRLLSATPACSIILLEDIDSIFVKRQQVSIGGERHKGVSFSGLLNALDGVRAQEGRIVFMTTNHKENLDPALLRPGRADVHVFLNNASSSQMQRVFLKFFEAETQKALEFSEKLPEFKVSMAKLQGHLLKYRKNVDDCLKNVEEITKEVKEDDRMSVNKWLNRLNMQHYIPYFHEKKIYTIADLKNYTDMEKVKEQLKIEDEYLLDRYNNHVNGDDNYDQDYQYLTEHQSKSIIMDYFEDQKYVRELAALIQDDQITGFQLKDILNPEVDYQATKQKVSQQLEMNNRINKYHLFDYLFDIQEQNDHLYQQQTKEKQHLEKLSQDVQYDLQQLFEDCGQNQYIREQKQKKEQKKFKEKQKKEAKKKKEKKNSDNKDKEEKEEEEKEEEEEEEEEENEEDQILFPIEILKDQHISNVQFWQLGESDFESILKVTKYGIKKNLIQMVEQIKSEHQIKIQKEQRQQKKAKLQTQQTTK